MCSFLTVIGALQKIADVADIAEIADIAENYRIRS